jgi:hypothetical protein
MENGSRAAGGITSIEDTAEALDVAAVARWSPGTRRDGARAQVLWMVELARRAARDGLGADARWWRQGAIRALWNVS